MTQPETHSALSPLRMLLRATWNAFCASVGAYAVSLSIFLLLHWGSEGIRTVALINNMLHLMLLPSLLLLPLMAFTRRWGLVVLLLLPFAVTMIDNAPAVLNRPATAPDGATEITVLTYNVLARRGDVYAETVTIIREADADIVALQEIGFDGGEAIEAAFADEYPYRALYPQPIGTQGQGILSRYPIIEHEWFQSPGMPVALGHMRALIEMDGREVVVYNVHPVHPFMSPDLDPAWRGLDIAGVLDRAAPDAQRYPTLVVGDFNMTPKTDDYAAVSATYTDAFCAVGRGFGYTFPRPSTYSTVSVRSIVPPLARLDYVFHDDDWLALDARPWDRAGGADHLPVWARLALLPE
ncbi:MAG: endonuclease/exonuclease/phosphatase family protein [Chloroflexota bacterium]